SHLESLSNSSAFLPYQKEGAAKPEDVASVVVHFTPAPLLNEHCYREWVEKFSRNTTHIYINENSRCLGSESVHKIQFKLNHLYPDSFSLLSDSKLFSVEEQRQQTLSKRLKIDLEEVEKPFFNGSNGKDHNELGDETLLNKCQAYTCLTYHIRPHLKIDESKKIKFNSNDFIKECYDIEGFQSTYDNVRTKVKAIKESIQKSTKERLYPNILFLGTGSCIPNKMRNTSGIVLNINSTSTMLLDCGEGTFGQLVRYLGASAADVFLRHLSLVYVSHLHADHHIGFIRILLGRKKAFQRAQIKQIPKLVLLAPRGIMHYLNSYSANFETISDQFTLISNKDWIEGQDSSSEVTEFGERCRHSLGIRELKTCFVHHCPNAFGVAITLLDGWKLVYSGDTMPCQALVSIGM
ncbi:UNVERIFIED_CONTAM: hypothetical protein GTU68_056033, partial [Idotea baltica]|nr:hypothetical protein [Idotea baltica]